MAMGHTEATGTSIRLLDIDKIEGGIAFDTAPLRRCERMPDQTPISSEESSKPSVEFIWPPIFLSIWG